MTTRLWFYRPSRSRARAPGSTGVGWIAAVSRPSRTLKRMGVLSPGYAAGGAVIVNVYRRLFPPPLEGIKERKQPQAVLSFLSRKAGETSAAPPPPAWGPWRPPAEGPGGPPEAHFCLHQRRKIIDPSYADRGPFWSTNQSSSKNGTAALKTVFSHVFLSDLATIYTYVFPDRLDGARV